MDAGADASPYVATQGADDVAARAQGGPGRGSTGEGRGYRADPRVLRGGLLHHPQKGWSHRSWIHRGGESGSQRSGACHNPRLRRSEFVTVLSVGGHVLIGYAAVISPPLVLVFECGKGLLQERCVWT